MNQVHTITFKLYAPPITGITAEEPYRRELAMHWQMWLQTHYSKQPRACDITNKGLIIVLKQDEDGEYFDLTCKVLRRRRTINELFVVEI